ncbi:hypothetical protein [Qipengyuania atrilutea]|uniref:Lipoprotein n=1 Tax=Qipengyuania atrilutea TaxID=2744473 RepID=A0A850GZJ7_9SPHN|nr:hypothetical protein [Actirhodobacter atriluteus]NVD43640.1 hypothetical protein [Actirhodobacter atriluteus]
MKKLVPLFAAITVLAGCGEEAAEPVATETTAAAPAPEPTSTLPAPDQGLFTEVFAETCPDAEPVSNAVCRRAMGADNVTCEFGLGEDQYLRHEAQLSATEDNWELADAPAICAEHGSHHVDQ